MVKFWSKKGGFDHKYSKNILKNIFFGLSESGSWGRFRGAFMAPKSSVQTIVMVHLSSKYGQNVVEKKIFWPKTGKINFCFCFSEFNSWGRFQGALIRPSRSVFDRVKVIFMSLFCSFMSTWYLDYLCPNYGLKMTLTRSETDQEGRMRAPWHRQSKFFHVIEFV